MRNVQKILLFILVLLMTLILIPSFSKAATRKVGDEEHLLDAIENATENDVIELTQNIDLTRPIDIVSKKLTIDGKGFTISKGEGWSANGNNGTLITAGADATLTLKNLKLTNAQKYGVQSYNGGYVILDGVTISNCGFGGVLVNAGTVEVRNLVLNRNGSTSNNGIEIAKGYSVNTGDNQPTLIMNGTLTSTEKENVVYIAINDKLSEFVVENGENAVNKILVNDNKVVITDQYNNVLYESNETDKEIGGETFAKNITITVALNDKTVAVTVQEGDKLTKEQLTEKINLKELGFENYTIAGFYNNKEFTEEFDFTKTITQDTTIYAKLNKNAEKDPTPKTGVEDNSALALFIMIASIVSFVALKRKEDLIK